MIAHIVLFTPRPHLSLSDRQQFAEAFEHAVRTIPSVRGVTVGKRVVHGAEYENGLRDAPAFVAVIEFEDVAGLRSYLQHAAHDQLSVHFQKSLGSAAVYDFEIDGLESLGNLVWPTR